MKNLRQQIENLRRRFALLDEIDELPGMKEVAAGLREYLDSLEPDAIDDEERVNLIIHGLSGVADILESETDEDDLTASEESGDDGLDQFVTTFRNDAGKRLRGLSISLMGIFGEQGSDEALEQSTDHLHAIRGSAAMLGLDDIAELSAEMENVLVAMGKKAPDHRGWPTKTLLRGFALLEEAIERDPPAICETQEVGELMEVLREVSSRDTTSATPVASGAESSEASLSSAHKNADASTPPQSPAPDHRLEQPILVVDDVDTIAASVAFILSELEVPIEIASNGQQAIQMLREKPFSLVISDVDMPRMDGIALTKMIRSAEEWSQLPVILLTSLDHPEERQAGMDAGATDYIIKGAIGGGELLRRVRELLTVAPVVERKKKQRRRRILVAEDTETVAASIAFVLSEGPFEIVLATDGKDALRHLEDNDFDLLITDMQMPYMTGTELVETLRSDDELTDLPVIMLTSVDDQQMAAEAFDAGINRYLLKGEIAGGKLLSVVEQLLSDH